MRRRFFFRRSSGAGADEKAEVEGGVAAQAVAGNHAVFFGFLARDAGRQLDATSTFVPSSMVRQRL